MTQIVHLSPSFLCFRYFWTCPFLRLHFQCQVTCLKSPTGCCYSATLKKLHGKNHPPDLLLTGARAGHAKKEKRHHSSTIFMSGCSLPFLGGRGQIIFGAGKSPASIFCKALSEKTESTLLQGWLSFLHFLHEYSPQALQYMMPLKEKS